MTAAIETTVKEHPILFSGPMIRAILENRKTQTRRVIKPQPEAAWMNWVINTNLGGDNRYWVDGEPTMHLNMKKDFSSKGECPYGKPGDRLWVRETFCVNEVSDEPKVFYQADGYMQFPSLRKLKWKPSIFLPRASSRITLEITDVRVEQVQRINVGDAIAEGIEPLYSQEAIKSTVGLEPYRFGEPVPWTNYLWHGRRGGTEGYSSAENAVDSYRSLWDSINGKKQPWASNSWVWVVEFKRVEVSK